MLQQRLHGSLEEELSGEEELCVKKHLEAF